MTDADRRAPDEQGRFGEFGGRFVPEILMPAIMRLQEGVDRILPSEHFRKQLEYELHHWVGRPTALSPAPGLSRSWGAEIWLKREDLAHTGAHKINNAIGQALLARELGAKRVIAETGAGQHGVASAAACARLGLPCVVYMGSVDVARQSPNVARMEMLGAEVIPVDSGDQTLRSAIDEAMRAWVKDPTDSYYLLGSVVGPHPYPFLVRELQAIIGREARHQMLMSAGSLPEIAVACVGGGSNAMGLFHEFIGDAEVRLVGVEAGGEGDDLGQHAATLSRGSPGVLHGCFSYLLQDEDGQVQETHSISAGLDYPGVGPEHSLLKTVERVEYMSASDLDALEALNECCLLEGILPALESAHALAGAKKLAGKNGSKRILVCMSGRGDKDLQTLMSMMQTETLG